jgi:hypothetical protein
LVKVFALFKSEKMNKDKKRDDNRVLSDEKEKAVLLK